jgi:hypothetical protein
VKRTTRKPAPDALTASAALSDHRRDAELEAWICKKLALRDLFAGATSTDTRRDRLKVVLLERGLTESIAGAIEGKPVTWRKVFTRLYHVELTT